jgi:hypothetical protein
VRVIIAALGASASDGRTGKHFVPFACGPGADTPNLLHNLPNLPRGHSMMTTRRSMLSWMFGSALAIASVSAAWAQEPNLDEPGGDRLAGAVPSGTVDIEAKSLRLLVGGNWGGGVLHYQGNDYPFSVKGLTVGGVGFVEVDATGDVYFLNNLEDFEGTYGAATIGVTVAKGKGGGEFENSKGVVIRLKAKTKGVALSLGTGGIQVKFTEPQQ